jgi:hypothetical protein
MNTRSRPIRIAANVLIFLGGIALAGSALAKIAHVPIVVTQMAAVGFFGGRLLLIALLESICAVLFLIPITRSIGLLLVSGYLGGAIATHIGHGQPPFQPAFLLILLWLGIWLRHPEILWSLQLHGVQASNDVGQQQAANSQVI